MNTITQFLPYAQLILSILLILAILLQRSGEGIEGALGGTASTITRFARRGGEQFLFFATIVIAVLLIISLIIGILMS
jgi:protein translocase SecG subunit